MRMFVNAGLITAPETSAVISASSSLPPALFKISAFEDDKFSDFLVNKNPLPTKTSPTKAIKRW